MIDALEFSMEISNYYWKKLKTNDLDIWIYFDHGMLNCFQNF